MSFAEYSTLTTDSTISDSSLAYRYRTKRYLIIAFVFSTTEHAFAIIVQGSCFALVTGNSAAYKRIAARPVEPLAFDIYERHRFEA